MGERQHGVGWVFRARLLAPLSKSVSLCVDRDLQASRPQALCPRLSGPEGYPDRHRLREPRAGRGTSEAWEPLWRTWGLG